MIIIITVNIMLEVKPAGGWRVVEYGLAVPKPYLYAYLASKGADFIIISPENVPSNILLLFVSLQNIKLYSHVCHTCAVI
jgi:hypothetical protein